jgi:hypothetical protein
LFIDLKEFNYQRAFRFHYLLSKKTLSTFCSIRLKSMV